MGRQMMQIEEIAREIEHVSSDLQDLYATLGEYAISHSNLLIETVESKNLYQKFISIADQSDSLKTRIKRLKELHNSILDGKNRVKEIEIEKKELIETMTLLYSRIGAIAWEESYSHVLHKDIVEKIPTITQLHADYSSLTTQHLEAKNRANATSWFLKVPFSINEKVKKSHLNKLLKSNTKSFIEFGEIIATSSLISLLVSERAIQIGEEYDLLYTQIIDKDDELVMVKEQMHASKDQLEQEGLGGSLAKKIGELENSLKESTKQRKLAALMYGKAVTTMMSTEKEKEFPKEMDECFLHILDQQYIKTQLLRTTKKLSIEQKIEELVLLLKQDEDHILHIEVQIGQLNHQIEEINRTMATKKEQIGKLQNQLVKVLPLEITNG
ncbi:MAG: hypothetical protein EOM67_03120 [Spirochaetia bacterium]|nr:hypothetical protein [Spirochaetia bacterium]